jgi:hypothetical protein
MVVSTVNSAEGDCSSNAIAIGTRSPKPSGKTLAAGDWVFVSVSPARSASFMVRNLLQDPQGAKKDTRLRRVSVVFFGM